MIYFYLFAGTDETEESFDDVVLQNDCKIIK